MIITIIIILYLIDTILYVLAPYSEKTKTKVKSLLPGSGFYYFFKYREKKSKIK